MVPTVYIIKTDESLIIASTIGAIISIILIGFILSHITFQVYKQLYKNQNDQKKKNKIKFIHTKKGKRIIILSYIALFLYLISCISLAFVRSNFIIGNSYNPFKNCNIGWILVYHGNSTAKTIIYSIFLYRLYISFKYSANPVPKLQLILVLTFVWITLLFLVIATATIIAIENPMINSITPNGIIFCGTPKDWPTLFRECIILIIFTDFIFNFYILYAFISRLRHIRKQWLDQLNDESTAHSAYSSEKPKFKKSESSLDTVKNSKDRQSAKKILKLSRLMMKLTYLVLLAVFSSWIAWISASVYTLASLLYTYDVMVNSMCLWLLLSTTENMWKKCVDIFYYPCCCCCICPSLRRVDEIDGVKEVIEITPKNSTETTLTTNKSGTGLENTDDGKTFLE